VRWRCKTNARGARTEGTRRPRATNDVFPARRVKRSVFSRTGAISGFYPGGGSNLPLRGLCSNPLDQPYFHRREKYLRRKI
jgi:hypothetical protein